MEPRLIGRVLLYGCFDYRLRGLAVGPNGDVFFATLVPLYLEVFYFVVGIDGLMSSAAGTGAAGSFDGVRRGSQISRQR